MYLVVTGVDAFDSKEIGLSVPSTVADHVSSKEWFAETTPTKPIGSVGLKTALLVKIFTSGALASTTYMMTEAELDLPLEGSLTVTETVEVVPPFGARQLTRLKSDTRSLVRKPQLDMMVGKVCAQLPEQKKEVISGHFNNKCID